MEKRFIRFICNTSQHPRGEKIHVLGTITKIYDDNGKFLNMKSGYIHARENEHEIDIDIEGTDYKPYLPLHHFKLKNGSIIKKSNAEIQKTETRMAQEKQIKETERQERELAKLNLEAIIKDDSKTDSEKLDALIKLQG